MDSEQRRLYRTMAVSGVIHLVVIGLLMAAPRFAHRSSMTAPIISVDLVSLPKSAGPPGPPAAARPAAEKPAAKAPPTKPPPAKKAVVIEKKPEISLKPAKKRAKPLPREKVSLKEKTFKPPAVKKKAIKEMARKVEKTETQSRQATLDALAKKVATQEVARQSAQPSNAGAAAGTGGEGGGVAGRLVSQAEGFYIGEAALTIQSNWAYSEQLAGGARHLEVLLGVKVLASGEIADVWFDQRSGNRYLDEAARKAVLKSNPLPPFPVELRKNYIKFGLRFKPEGLQL